MKFINSSILLLFLVTIHHQILAQESNLSEAYQSQTLLLTKKQNRKNRPAFISIGIGFDISKYRDLGTSPLFYHGYPIEINLGFLRKNMDRESGFNINYNTGKFKTRSEYNSTNSSLNKIDLQYSKLYKLNRWSQGIINSKLGFWIEETAIIRINPYLNNNALGLINIFNLGGSFKLTKDISRKNTTQKKLWFIKYTLRKDSSDMAFRFNLGLWNNNFNNGYAYLGPQIVTQNYSPIDGYQMHWFAGLRFGAQFDLTKYLKNKNGYQISYILDAFKSGGQYNQFGMINNSIRFTLFFNTNNQ